MSTSHKAPSEPKEAAGQFHTAGTNYPTDFVNLFTGGMQRAIEIGTTSLDLAARQNAEMVSTSKTFVQLAPMPAMAMIDFVGQTFERVVETQKRILNIMAR